MEVSFRVTLSISDVGLKSVPGVVGWKRAQLEINSVNAIPVAKP
jgi:hypothetical protein